MICIKEDDYIQELQMDRAQALWCVELSNGEVVIQDDGRPGTKISSAWLRLATYVFSRDLTIRKMWLKFRTNEVHPLPANADGYYFCKSVIGMMNSDQTTFQYLIGALQDGKLTVQRWYVPALVMESEQERDPANAGDCLITNHGPKYAKALLDRIDGVGQSSR